MQYLQYDFIVFTLVIGAFLLQYGPLMMALVALHRSKMCHVSLLQQEEQVRLPSCLPLVVVNRLSQLFL